MKYVRRIKHKLNLHKKHDSRKYLRPTAMRALKMIFKMLKLAPPCQKIFYMKPIFPNDNSKLIFINDVHLDAVVKERLL